jgi:hypothetical protein
MESAHSESKTVAAAVGDALRNEALSEAIFTFGSAKVILTKTQRLTGEPLGPDDAPPEYPIIPTTLADDADSWLK